MYLTIDHENLTKGEQEFITTKYHKEAFMVEVIGLVAIIKGDEFLVDQPRLRLRLITKIGLNTHHHPETFLRVLGFIGG